MDSLGPCRAPIGYEQTNFNLATIQQLSQTLQFWSVLGPKLQCLTKQLYSNWPGSLSSKVMSDFVLYPLQNHQCFIPKGSSTGGIFAMNRPSGILIVICCFYKAPKNLDAFLLIIHHHPSRLTTGSLLTMKTPRGSSLQIVAHTTKTSK